MANKRLYRSGKNKIVGGVAGGLAEYLDADINLVRLITLLVVLTGVGLVAYVIGWVIIPADPACKENGSEKIKDPIEEVVDNIRVTFDNVIRKRKERTRSSVGWILIIFGVFFLIEAIAGLDIWIHLWPIALILLGFILIIRNLEK